jgi:hypothetical protein
VRRHSFIHRSPTGLNSAAWLPDSSGLVIGGGWTRPFLLPVDSGRPVVEGPRDLGSIDRIVTGPDGKAILKEVWDWIWDTRSNTLTRIDLKARDFHRWGDRGVAILTGTKLFLRRWQSDGLGPATELPVRGERFAISASGNRAVIFRNKALAIYDLPAGKLRAELPFPEGDVWRASISADGSRIVARALDGPVIVWSLDPLYDPAREVADGVQRQTGRVSADFALHAPLAEPSEDTVERSRLPR